MDEEKTKTAWKKLLTIVIIIATTLLVLFLMVFSWLLIKNPLNARGIFLYKLGWVDTPVQIVPAKNLENNTDKSIDEKTDSELTEDSANTDTKAPVNALPMTSEQKKAVEDFGIDPNSIVITVEMESCFVEKLGQKRVDEIIKGDTPGTFELLKASSCL